MKRRDFLTLSGSAAVTWPRAARAQQAAAPVIGILTDGLQEAYEARRLPGFVRGLSDEGLAVGRNVTIASRWANGNYDLLPSSQTWSGGMRASSSLAAVKPSRVRRKPSAGRSPLSL